MEKDFLLSESIQERDIDMILLEELNCNKSFCDFIIKENNLPKLYSDNIAWKSISDFGLGETDILFSYKNDEKTIFILIENKLDAEFQTNQFNRYQERGLKYLKEKKCDELYIILIAPHEYCTNQQEFEKYISYESIKKFFLLSGDERSNFKSQLLSIGIEKLRRGYQPINDIRVYKFWKQYNNLLKSKTEELTINPSALKVVPSGADWIFLKNDKIQRLGIQIIHKLHVGYIDLQIKDIKLLDQKIDFGEYEIVETGKSKSIRSQTCSLNRFSNFENQIKEIEASVEKVIEAYNFCVNNFSITGRKKSG